MRVISAEQLEVLKQHLSKKPFTYEEVYHEILDHYAAAYEETDQPMEQVIKELDKRFPDHKIEAINRRYFNDLRRHLRKTSFTIFSGYFRWPQILTTMLAGLVFYLLAPFFIEFRWLRVSLFLVFAAVPILLSLYFYFRWVARRVTRRSKLKNAHAELFGMAMGFSILYAQLPTFGRLIYDDDFKLLVYDPLLTAGILFLGLIIFISSLKLLVTKIKPGIG